MPEYAYKAIDQFGKEKKGTMKVDTIEAVYDTLRVNGMTPIEVGEATLFNREINISIGNPIKPRDLSVFCRQFISMIGAGITIIDALDMLSEQTENKVLSKALGGVKMEIGKGETLSNAMAGFPKVFPDIMVKMIAAGEASGKLEIAFDRMGAHFEKSAKLKAILKKAAVYPIMIGLLAVIVIIVMLTFVIPRYSTMFADLDTELPALTVMVVNASNFLIKKWYVAIAVVAAVVGGFMFFKKSQTGKVVLSTISRKAPIFGKLTVKSAASNFSRTLSTLIYSGLPMVEALAITAGTMSNLQFRNKVEEAREEVMRGIPLSEPLLRDKLFPPMIGHMTRIGEETGQLEDMLTKMADYYDEEVEMATQTVLAAMEPMIIMLLAGIVCVLLGSVLAPMLTLYNSLDSL
ncbi:MAG: type II secretion system F family protein [Agathobacter sp.]|nr:type II secretion system F family protein [Agathobacter sp.]